MTYKQAAQSAIDVQNACNSSGIIRSLSEVTSAIYAEATTRGLGTRWVNRHPVIAMYLYKLGEMNGYGICTLDRGYEQAEKLVLNIIAGGDEPNYATAYPEAA